MDITIQPIGVIHSCYTEKFGIPRQPGLVTSAVAELELYSPWNRPETVSGLIEFSHVWVHFLFHKTVDQGWKSTVRPPGLGGKKKVGVFASRSPHRPNHMGMSVVRLLGVEEKKGGVVLRLGGGDFLNGTPVLDIKPYARYSDSIVDASSSYAGTFSELEVLLLESAEQFCREYKSETGRDLATLIREVLLQDPRPASQRVKRDEFGILLYDVNIRFRVERSAEGEGLERLVVYGCERVMGQENR